MIDSSFFLPGECVERAYRNIRDGSMGPVPEARAFTEYLWHRYRGYQDTHFLRDARNHFIERFWEMYLAVTFMERGFELSKQNGAGPEFSYCYEGQKTWVEAVAPGPGAAEDRVQKPQTGMVCDVPTDKILLRFTHALAEKRKRYLVALEKGIVSEQDCYVLAINSRRIPHAPFGNSLPFFVQALLPIGFPTLLINRTTRQTIDSFYALRESVTKATGVAISTAPFLGSDYSFVSAVLHSAVDCVNRPPTLGGDFEVLHNPSAARPICPKAFDWCDQFTYTDGILVRAPANTALESAGAVEFSGV